MRNSLLWLMLTLCSFNSIHSKETLDHESREQEEGKLKLLYQQFAKFYEMPEGSDLIEITEKILQSPHIQDILKDQIIEFNRRIFVFIYPSDGLKIKGVISISSHPENYPLIVYLRGGNRIYGIPNPGNFLLNFEHYNFLTTTYRGGVSEGEDEFGGNDVNDVKNLMDFLPELEKKLGINLQQRQMYLLSCSRGGMQMFLALARFPELQNRFAKIASLSGLLDMRQSLAERPDLEEMFTKNFGLTIEEKEEWINRRDPLLAAEKIRQDLPILIVQGTDDNRVSLEQGYNMVSKLESMGNNVTYWEFDGGNHCLSNIQNRTEMIVNWFEE